MPIPPPSRVGSVVAVCAGFVAFGASGHGLLEPAGAPAPLVRPAGVLVALVAIGVLRWRGVGPKEAAWLTATAVVILAAVALLTFPVSNAHLDWLADAVPGGGDDPAGTPGPGGTETVTVPGIVLLLPEGFRPEVHGSTIVLVGPDGLAAPVGPTIGGDPIDVPDGTELPVTVDAGGVASTSGPVQVVLGEAELGDGQLRAPDGRRFVLDGVVLLELPPSTNGSPLQGVPQRDPVTSALAVVLAAFLLVFVLPPVVRPRLAPPTPDEDEVVPELGPVVAAAEVGLADALRAMLEDPDPRSAVIAAYSRLLTGLAAAGAPRRPEEGPHEHLWRVLTPLGVREGPVHRLADLFVQARFTPFALTAADRDRAAAALADALADLRLGRAEAVPPDQRPRLVGVAG